MGLDRILITAGLFQDAPIYILTFIKEKEQSNDFYLFIFYKSFFIFVKLK